MPVLLTLLAVVAILMAILATLSVVLARKYHIHPPADEIYAAHTPDGWKIRLFRHKHHRGTGEPVLVIPGAAANHYEFELPRDDSLADTLSDNGYDVWILDPRGRRSSTPPFGRKHALVSTDDMLLHDLPTAVDYVRAATRFEHVHLIGHSLGGMLIYAYDVAYGRDNIASAVTLAAPVGFERVDYHTPRLLFFLSKVSRPLLEALTRLGSPIVSRIRPKSRLLPINWDNLHPDIDGRAFYHAVQLPTHRVAEELDNWARNKVWRMHGGEIDVAEGLADLEIPLFAIFGGGDPLTPAESVREFYDNLDLKDKELLVLSRENGYSADYNHIDLVLGRNSRAEVFDRIVVWLKRHRTTQRLKPVRTAAELEADAASPGTVQEESDAYVRESRGEVGQPLPPSVARRTASAPEPEEFEPTEEGLGVPVLPGATNEELARLARDLREEDGPDEDEPEVAEEAPPSRHTARKAAARRNSVPKKPTAKKKPAAKKPVAKKKPPARRKPRP